MIVIKNIDTGLLYEINPTQAHGESAMPCPSCSPERKKKRDKCFSWNVDERVGRCNHCQSRFVEYRPFKERQAKEYAIPEWKNITALTKKAVTWFEGRMISQGALAKMKVYSDKVWMPQFRKEVEVMCFPYFLDGKLVNIKSRGPQKSFKMEPGAELIFYNIDCVTPDTKEVIICEGEIDALSFVDSGHLNVISVPNGAGATDLPYLDNYIERFEKIKKFYIATDFDEPGIKLRNELIRRLGADRCVIVTYEGHKDANDLFKSQGGMALHRVLENAQDVPISGIISLESKYDDIQLMFREGLPEGSRIGIDGIDKHVRWQTSRLAIWTGIPSHGKSEMVDHVVLRLNLLHGWKALFFSPENFPLEFHYAKLASKLTGKRFKSGAMTDQEFEQSFDYILSNFFWMDPYKEATLESVLERAEAHVRKYGIKQLVIDPYNCLEHNNARRGETESVYIGRFLDALSRFSKKYDILIHLVAHPAKMEKDKKTGIYPAPTLYDISGSANFYNKADYGLTVYRDFIERRAYLIITKVKFKNLGEPHLDGVELQYNSDNGRYQEPPGDIYAMDSSNWLKSNNGEAPETNDRFDFDYNNEIAPF